MASATNQHLQLYNPTQTKTDRTFPKFDQLPQELRLYIWELALPCERFLKIRLCGLSSTGSIPHRALASTEKGDDEENYDRIILSGRKVVPKLLHVCKESKIAALKFYRVQIPCDYGTNDDHKHPGEGNGKGTFYFNPEFDILKIRSGRRKESFADFLLDLRARDPKNVGLLNLTMDLNDLGCNAFKDADLEAFNADARHAFVDTLSSLKQALFMCVESAGRMYLGPLHGIPDIDGWEMHRSLPIAGSVPRFERLKPDPRNIDEDLKKVYLGTFEPRKMVVQWKKLLQKYNVKPRPDVQHRFLTACEPRPQGMEIFDRKSADNYILHEDKEWRDGVDRWEQRLKKTKIERETPEFLQTVPQTAIGFWMFPLEALGELPPDNLNFGDGLHDLRRGKRVIDMSKFRPELAVLDL